MLVVHATGPWIDGPYLDQETVRTQLATARNATLFVAVGSSHSDLIRRPSLGLIAAIRDFVLEARTHAAEDLPAGPYGATS